MASQQVIAPPCAQSGSPGTLPGLTQTSGVIHVNVRHVSGFVVIGNHLAQHHELSLIAIGLAVHIQSLPAGAKVGIKVLTDRFPESEARITAALHELEAEGYLRRSRLRLPDGRVVTRTISYNQPDPNVATTPPPPRPLLPRPPSRHLSRRHNHLPPHPHPPRSPRPCPPPSTYRHPPPPGSSPRRSPNPTHPPPNSTAQPQHSSPTSAATHPNSPSPKPTSRHSPPA